MLTTSSNGDAQPRPLGVKMCVVQVLLSERTGLLCWLTLSDIKPLRYVVRTGYNAYIYINKYKKFKSSRYRPNRPGGCVELQLYSFLNSALEGGGCSAPRPGRFTPGKDPVPIVQNAGWTSGPVWTCAKNLAPTWIRSQERPARSPSLYRLSYPAHINKYMYTYTHICIHTYVHIYIHTHTHTHTVIH
jgi:hypothetical protein